SKITSGTFDAARLPAASTSQRGIVQLTNSRSSTSETLAVTAAALNAHRTSADHDDRYYTKQQVDQLLAASSGRLEWATVGNTVLVESLDERQNLFGDRRRMKAFEVLIHGQYRITGEYRRTGIDATAWLIIGVQRHGGGSQTLSSTQISYTGSSFSSFTFDVPSTVILYPGDVLYVDSEITRGSGSIYVRNVRLRAQLGVRPYVARVVQG